MPMLRTLLALALTCKASGATLGETRPRPALALTHAPPATRSSQLVTAAPNRDPVRAVRGGGMAKFDVPLLLYFVFWYVGNMFYNKYNTMALKAVGGKYGGLTMTVATLSLTER